MIIQTPPERHRDLTFENRHTVCSCGAEWHQHFDGWDGNRLSCAEAVRRHGIALGGPGRCVWCAAPLSGNCEIRDENYPYCSAACAVQAERS